MSIFSDGGGEGSTMSTRPGEQCKPDYEKLVADLKKLNSSTITLYECLLDYVETHRISMDLYRTKDILFTLPALLGSLVLEKGKQQKQIDGYMAEMEKE